ncbi:HIT family protein [Candidatus Woesearchaeota archaeon]|nr:HIT family protein [Candidatus Woesearchaeota archaeon]
MNDCIFCKIIKQEIPCYKVYEDSDCLAFLDINPMCKGHTVVIPKKHYALITEMEEKDLSSLMNGVQKVAKALMDYGESVNIIQNNGPYAGQVINHVHIHVVPRNKDDGLHLGQWRTTKFENMDEIKEEIKKLF